MMQLRKQPGSLGTFELLRSSDNEVLVYAAQAFGHLAIPSGTLTAELVKSEVKSALK